MKVPWKVKSGDSGVWVAVELLSRAGFLGPDTFLLLLLFEISSSLEVWMLTIGSDDLIMIETSRPLQQTAILIVKLHSRSATRVAIVFDILHLDRGFSV